MFKLNKANILKTITGMSAFSCLEIQLQDLLANRTDAAVLEHYQSASSSTDYSKREWFLGQPFGYSFLFHLCPTSSVSHPVLRRLRLRSQKHEAYFKDAITFFVLATLMPRASLALYGLSLCRNLLLNVDIEDEALLDALEWTEVGRYTRIAMMAIPLRAFI